MKPAPRHTLLGAPELRKALATQPRAPLALQLRGGGLRQPRTVEAPNDEFPTVHDGLAAVCKGDLLRIMPGFHRWGSPVVAGARTIKFEGTGNAWLFGAMIFYNGSTGSFTNLTLLAEADSGEDSMEPSTITCDEGAWNLTDCEVQSVGGISLSASCGTRIGALRCSFGGGGDGTERARDGVHLSAAARAELRGCALSHTTGFGLRVFDDAFARLTRCRLSENPVAFSVQDDAELGVYDSVVQSQLAAFRVADESRYTVRVLLNGNSFNNDTAKLWLGNAQPVRMPGDHPDVAGTEEMSDPDIIKRSAPRHPVTSVACSIAGRCISAPSLNEGESLVQVDRGKLRPRQRAGSG